MPAVGPTDFDEDSDDSQDSNEAFLSVVLSAFSGFALLWTESFSIGVFEVSVDSFELLELRFSSSFSTMAIEDFSSFLSKLSTRFAGVLARSSLWVMANADEVGVSLPVQAGDDFRTSQASEVGL